MSSLPFLRPILKRILHRLLILGIESTYTLVPLKVVQRFMNVNRDQSAVPLHHKSHTKQKALMRDSWHFMTCAAPAI
jgi:hypothetical protein